MNRLLASLALLTVLLAVGGRAAPPAPFDTRGKDTYGDGDWTLTLYDNCGLPVTAGESRSIGWRRENHRRFLRVQLSGGDVGHCAADARPRDRAAFWERAELKQAQPLERNRAYALSFEVRFVEGFGGDRETFWQLHGQSAGCPAPPAVMLKFEQGALRILVLRESAGAAGHRGYDSGVDIADVTGRWNAFRLVFDTSQTPMLSVYLNGRPILVRARFAMPRCARPYVKLGIYRPGRAGAKRSVVDFDKITLAVLD